MKEGLRKRKHITAKEWSQHNFISWVYISKYFPALIFLLHFFFEKPYGGMSRDSTWSNYGNQWCKELKSIQMLIDWVL